MVKVIVAVDAENVSHKLLSSIEQYAAGLGSVVCRRVFGDFSMPRMRSWQDALQESLFQKVETPHIRCKNVADMTMIIDIIEEIHTHSPDIVIIGTGDGDFVPLVTRLKEKGIQVIGVGTLEASRHFREACSDFKTIEMLDPTPLTDNSSPPLPKYISKTILRVAAELMRNSRKNDWIAISNVGDAISSGAYELNLRQHGIANLSEAIGRHPAFEMMREGKNVFFRKKVPARQLNATRYNSYSR